MSNTISLTGKEIFGLRRLGEFKYSEESELKGQTYYRYSAKGTVFTVNTKEDFNNDFDAKNIAEVHFLTREEETEDGKKIYWSLDYHVTQDQLINFATFDAKIKQIEAGQIVATEKLSAKELNELA